MKRVGTIVVALMAVLVVSPARAGEERAVNELKRGAVPVLTFGATRKTTIDELKHSPVSLLTLGLARIETRMERLSETHDADFRASYDAATGRIRISIETRKMKTTKENCAKLIHIVRDDAQFNDFNGDSPPTRYAFYFRNADEDVADVDKFITVEATINKSFDTGQLTFRDKISCSGALASSDVRF